jgi:hypothetical protein
MHWSASAAIRFEYAPGNFESVNPGAIDSVCKSNALSALRDGERQRIEGFDGGVPVDASVRNALPVAELPARHMRLLARDQIALDHHADDTAVSGSNLIGHRIDDIGLVFRVIAAIGMARVDHDGPMQS